jgi:anti-sigma B factor antagonist
MGLEITTTRDGATARVEVSGDLDMTTGEQLERALVAAEADGPSELVLDLSRVGFFDSTGLQILLDADVRARAAERRFKVVAGDGEAARVMALTAVAERLQVAEIS